MNKLGKYRKGESEGDVSCCELIDKYGVLDCQIAFTAYVNSLNPV